jgi:N-acetylglucosamine kinase-like BadF-type ATPase
MTEWIFGIDGGGTGSRIRVEGMDGSLICRAEGGGCNPHAASLEAASAAMAALIAEAAESAGLAPADCRAGFIGSAGVDTLEERVAISRLVAEAAGLPAVLGAGSDAEAALAGALRSPEGYVLIAGTGSIALARAADGGSCRAGGWGHSLGDEGSAFWLAFEAIKRGIRGHEGRAEKTSLFEAALDFFALKEAAEFKRLVYADFNKARIARFAHRVEEERKAGDAVARGLFAEAAYELAGLVASVYGRFGAKVGVNILALFGGLLDNNEALRALTADQLGKRCPRLVIAPRLSGAEEGACLLARARGDLGSSSA